ncbi:MAG TPA: hypothetical protein VGF94_07490 [Kofleriaceae bacterium]|jgi:hypothetical protein
MPRTFPLAIALACAAAAVGEATPATRCEVAGTWTGTADDETGGHWTFTLELAAQGDKLSGVFHWKGALTGDEFVRGSVDCAAGTMALDAYKVTGDLALGAYRVGLGADGTTFRGKWTCITPCIEGSIAGKKR